MRASANRVPIVLLVRCGAVRVTHILVLVNVRSARVLNKEKEVQPSESAQEWKWARRRRKERIAAVLRVRPNVVRYAVAICLNT
jgi:hypothetical protein